jgi:hypothetical protein
VGRRWALELDADLVGGGLGCPLVDTRLDDSLHGWDANLGLLQGYLRRLYVRKRVPLTETCPQVSNWGALGPDCRRLAHPALSWEYRMLTLAPSLNPRG